MRSLNHLLTCSIGTIALLSASSVLAQSPCDDLIVLPPRYDAFDPGRIEVWVTNQSAEIFSYPNFVLLDDQGQVLASETVATFGLAASSAHSMQVVPGANLPTGPFDATLQLFGNFGDTLFCSWSFQSLTLCTPEDCTPAIIHLTNTAVLTSFQAFWWVTNTATNEQVATGNFAMNEVDATQFDTLCLPPGEYVLDFSPFSPIDATYIMGITPNAEFTPGIDGTQQPDDTPLNIAFNWYMACSEGTNSVAEHNEPRPALVVDQGLLRITDPRGRALGEVSLWGSDGRLIGTHATNTSTAAIPVHALSTGIIVVRVMNAQGKPFAQRIYLP